MSKKNRNRQAELARQKAASVERETDQGVTTQSVERPATPDEQKANENSSLVHDKVASLIAEVEGAANFGKEYLQASTFCRRFNQMAINLHRSLNLEAVVVSEDPREVNVLHNFEVYGTWKPAKVEGADLQHAQTEKWGDKKVLNADGTYAEPVVTTESARNSDEPVAKASLPATPVSEIPPSREAPRPETPEEFAARQTDPNKTITGADAPVIDPIDRLPITPRPREAAESQTEAPNPESSDAIDKSKQEASGNT